MTDGAAIREAWPRVLAALIRSTGSVELAEDSVQSAVVRLHESGARPDNVAAWLTTTAKRIAIDELRREAAWRHRMPRLLAEHTPTPATLEWALGDDRLALLLVVSHPALSAETRLALALRFVLGVSTVDIADALLVAPAAMSARLSRAKRRISADGVRFDEPDPRDVDARMPDVLAIVHVLYTLGHTAPHGPVIGDAALAATAIELTRALRRVRPRDAEVAGLLSLLLFTEARATSREHGLDRADRTHWNSALIDEGASLAVEALPGGGRFALEAGIAGSHSTARSWRATDWPAICALYDRLVERWPSPTALLARAVARSYREGGLGSALDEVDAVAGAPERMVAAARADILHRLGRTHEARLEYRRAQALEGNDAVRAYLAARVP